VNGRPGLEIVVVEDDPSDVLLLMREFRKHNVANNVVLLEDGARALDYLLPEGARPIPSPSRVVILDLKLPKVNGVEVLRRMKTDERTRDVPVVVLTSSQEERDVRDAREAGADGYLVKPLKFDVFARSIPNPHRGWLLANGVALGGEVKDTV